MERGGEEGEGEGAGGVGGDGRAREEEGGVEYVWAEGGPAEPHGSAGGSCQGAGSGRQARGEGQRCLARGRARRGGSSLEKEGDKVDGESR